VLVLTQRLDTVLRGLVIVAPDHASATHADGLPLGGAFVGSLPAKEKEVAAAKSAAVG
jgi:hypothetical protein